MNDVVVPQRRKQRFAIFGCPDPGGVIDRSRHHATTVGAEPCPDDFRFMSQVAHRLTGGGVPEPGSSILGAAEDFAAIGTEPPRPQTLISATRKERQFRLRMSVSESRERGKWRNGSEKDRQVRAFTRGPRQLSWWAVVGAGGQIGQAAGITRLQQSFGPLDLE
jgi:hypothetical protein